MVLPSLRVLCAALTAAALAACTGVATQSYVVSKDLPAHVGYAAAQGPIPVAVVNNPFAGDKDNAGVLAAMQGQSHWPGVSFASSTGGNQGYLIVLRFGTPMASSAQYCRPDAPTSPAPAGRTHIDAVFCVASHTMHLISQATADTDRIDSPQDPRFARLMSDLFDALLPSNDPLYRSGAEPP